ncbi:MAG: FG-GAP-like repeat-containing protein [Bacteroidales bacterium]|nr:FG-GAP-like repeat-containing protein [Bacteroidales bacterium]
MKKISKLFILINFLAIQVLFAQQSSDSLLSKIHELKNEASVGTLPGSFSVSQSGAAAYTIPIDLPPGISGMTPELALVYNSQGGYGFMGEGWILGGISAISRTNSTYYFNNYPKEVNFADDQLVLNGNKMILVDQQTAEYRLEIDDITKVQKESFKNSKGKLIPYFKAYLKSGLIKVYGGTEQSQLVYGNENNPALKYHLSKIIDRYGNFIEYNYERNIANGTIILSSIKYTGHLEKGKIINEPEFLITFDYQNLEEPLKKTAYFSTGATSNDLYKYQIDKRLSKIIIFHNNIEIRKYILEYEQAGDLNEWFIKNISLIAGDEKLISTKFDWCFEKQSQNTTKKVCTETIYPAYDYNFFKFKVGDYNNDGLDDFVACNTYPNTNESNTCIELIISNGNDFSTVHSYYYGSEIFLISTGDFNGDGKSDLLIKTSEFNIKIIEFVYNSNTNEYGTIEHSICNIPRFTSIKTGDFNGDGLTDCIFYYPDGNLSLYKGNSDNFLVNGNIPNYYIGCNLDIDIGDFDGEGKLELLVVDTEEEKIDIVELNEHNTAFTIHEVNLFYDKTINNNLPINEKNLYQDFFSTDKKDLLLADFNQDGKTDIIVTDTVNNELKYYFSFGYDFEYKQTLVVPSNKNYFSSDVNGDNIPDIVTLNYANYEATIKYYYTNKNGLSLTEGLSFVIFDWTFFGSMTYFEQINFGNFSGTNKKDLIFSHSLIQKTPPYENVFGIDVCFYGKKTINKITNITNGLGKKIIIEYDPLPTSEYYTLEENDLKYPVNTFNPSIYLVTKVKESNGQEGFFLPTEYFYNNAIFHKLGKGFLGFKELSVKNRRAKSFIAKAFSFYGLEDKKYYYSFPSSTWQYTLSNGDIDKIVSFSTKQLSHNNTVQKENLIFFPYTSINLTLQFDINEEVNTITKIIAIKNEDYDIYGNPGKITLTKASSLLKTLSLKNQFISNSFKQNSEMISKIMDKQTIFEKTSVLNYWNDDSDNWMLGRMNELSVTKKAPNVPDITRHSIFSYYEDETQSNYGKLKSETFEPEEEKSITKEYTYDNYGNVLISKFDSYSNPTPSTERITETIYEEQYNHRFVTKIINPLSYIVSKQYNEAWGWETKTTDPNRLSVNYKYDNFGRLYEKTNPDGTKITSDKIWVNSKDNNAPPHSIYFIREKCDGLAPVIVYYDKLDRKLRTVSIGFDGTEIFEDIFYNHDNGLPTYSTKPYFAGQTQYKIYYFSDELNRPTKKVFPGERISEKSYNDLNVTFTNPKGQSEIKVFNVDEQLVQLIDNNGNIVKYNYDAEGKLIETYIQNYENTKITCEYDNFGKLLKISDPAIGIKEYKYNIWGELIEMKHNEEIEATAFEYDKLGRLIRKVEPDFGVSQFQYDNNFIGLPDGVGFFNTVNNNIFIKNFTYDDLGRNTEITETITHNSNSENFTTATTYDMYSRPEKLTYPSNFSISRTYNEFGYLDKIIRDNDNKILWEVNSLNASQQIEQIEYGNQITTTKSYYEETGFIKRIGTYNFSSKEDKYDVIQDFGYSWDDIGNLISKIENGQELYEDYLYDNLNRLISVKLNGGEATTNLDYDALGRILSKHSNNPQFHVANNYSYNNNNNPYELSSIDNKPVFYKSDNQEITYTSFDKITNIKQWDEEPINIDQELNLYYDYNHSRKIQIIDDNKNNFNQTKIYIGGIFEKITENDQIKEVHYITATDGIFAIYTKNSSTDDEFGYVHKDHLGSIQSLTNEEGNLVEKYSYDAWGLRRNPETGIPLVNIPELKTDRGFTGHEHLDLFNLINMNGRVYDPVVGYFSSPDPIIGIPKNSQGFNLYTYTKNNPLSYIDPSGYLEAEIAELGGGQPAFDCWTFELSRIGFLNASTSFFAGVFSGAFDEAIKNGHSKKVAYNLAYTAAESALAESEYAFVGEDPHKAANRELIKFFNAFEKYLDGKLNGSNKPDNSGVALHGILTGAEMINKGVKRSPDGQLNFNFSSLVVQSAISGTAARMGNAKTANGLATYTVRATLGGSGNNWLDITISYISKTVGGASSLTKGREIFEWEFLQQAKYNRALSGNFSQPVKHSLRVLKSTGRKLGYVGFFVSGADIAVNGVNMSNSLDLIMGGVAFIPGVGWAISGTYFIANIATQLTTGQSIGEHIQGQFTNPNATYKPW